MGRTEREIERDKEREREGEREKEKERDKDRDGKRYTKRHRQMETETNPNVHCKQFTIVVDACKCVHIKTLSNCHEYHL